MEQRSQRISHALLHGSHFKVVRIYFRKTLWRIGKAVSSALFCLSFHLFLCHSFVCFFAFHFSVGRKHAVAVADKGVNPRIARVTSLCEAAEESCNLIGLADDDFKSYSGFL